MLDREQVIEKISRQILDSMPSEGQCLISLDRNVYLLSISASVGEQGACKLWIQGQDSIKVDDDSLVDGPLEPFNQLIFKARVFDSQKKIDLIKRHGYASIPEDKEIVFLEMLLSLGEQDWGEWIGAKE